MVDSQVKESVPNERAWIGKGKNEERPRSQKHNSRLAKSQKNLWPSTKTPERLRKNQPADKKIQREKKKKLRELLALTGEGGKERASGKDVETRKKGRQHPRSRQDTVSWAIDS
ncbi:hypothetical protein BO70DRAFT_37638 [Aspergillus heteromorphus CBS 117.55]|uniref:Uncharacterized protein n=1 Tax=Aspergillus heteromorphus CBS 117.55 TaxID=1448321 RepID=A0A317W6I8_9EURO|nr:uncharacterized protein BO70DRAFT_37638 [Aspergillus heteromorphus CBS 117.55]PWY82236.1 hypothetical protein BO70DRAFT_37638 [Aspergillus heteromorphus CBS 117.55]